MIEVLASNNSKIGSSNLRLVVNNQPEEVVYEITTDPFLLSQYYKLREDCYRQDLGIKGFSGSEEDYDKIGSIAIARVGRRVIGGARMVMSLPNKRMKLPLEEENFIMKDLFPELELDKKGYFEIGRFAVRTGYRDAHISRSIANVLFSNAILNDCFYQFIVSSLNLFRNHRMIVYRLGFSHELLEHINVPTKSIYGQLNEIGIYLSVTYLSSDVKKILDNGDGDTLEVYGKKLVA